MVVRAGRGPGAIGKLALENWRRTDRNEFVFLQDELRIEAIAPRIVNGVAAKAAVKLVFVIVIKAEIQLFAVRCELFLLVEHDQLRSAPGLTRPSHVSPELVLRYSVITAADEIIAGCFRLDVLGRRQRAPARFLRHRVSQPARKNAARKTSTAKMKRSARLVMDKFLYRRPVSRAIAVLMLRLSA